MVKITNSGDQYGINPPKKIIDLTGWDETTDLAVFPCIMYQRARFPDDA